MAYATSAQHKKRLTRIEANRRAMKKGAIYSVNHDGLIIARARRRGLRRPVHLVLFAVFGVLAFKAALYAMLGASTYTSRVEALASGSAVERAGAWVMQADGLTVWAAMQINLLF